MKIYIKKFLIFIVLYGNSIYPNYEQIEQQNKNKATIDAVIPLLLYINPSINLNPNLVTQNCSVFYGNPDIIGCNRVFHKAVPTDEEVSTIIKYFEDIPFTWGVKTTDEETLLLLEQHGLKKIMMLPAMSLDLKILEPAVYDQDLSIQEVDLSDRAEIQEWAGLVAQSFTYVSQSALCNFIIKLYEVMDDNTLHLYLGKYQNKSACADMIIHHDEIATLHWVSVSPEFRNKKLGFAISHKALYDAQQHDCQQAFLLSSQLGMPVYHHLGFQECGQYYLYGQDCL